MSRDLYTSCLSIFLLLCVCLGFQGCTDSPGQEFEGRRETTPLPDNIDAYLHSDSVLPAIAALSREDLQFDSLLYLADLLKNYDEDVALVYAREAQNLGLSHNWDLARGLSGYYIALLKGRVENFGEGIEDALVDAKISLRLLQKSGTPAWIARTQSQIGYFHIKEAGYDSASHYLDRALATVEQGQMKARDSLILRGEILHGFFNLHFFKDQSRLPAIYQECLVLYQLTDNLPAMARLKIGMGIAYRQQKEYDKAAQLFSESIEYAKLNKDYNNLQVAYFEMGILQKGKYRKDRREVVFQEVRDYFRKSLEYQKDNFYRTYHQLAITYQYRSQGKVEDKQLYIDSALLNYKLAMEEARSEGALPVMKKMARNISSLCAYVEKQENRSCDSILGISNANLLHRNYSGVVDTITQSLKAANKRIQEFEREEVEAAGMRKRRTQLWLSGGILIVAILVFLILLQALQQKRLKARMEALRAQINPHFISNSLNAIESLVNQNKRDAASKYLIHFSRLSRRILNGSREATTTLEGELETLRHFLALEQLRFRDKLEYTIEVDPGLAPKFIEVPAMIMQPYVENAIWHGIKPKTGPGTLTVRASQEGKTLVCTIEDDGVGREKAAELKAASVLQQKSLGTQITEERLQATGRIRGARVETIDLKDEDGNAAGTRVQLRIPLKLKKEKIS